MSETAIHTASLTTAAPRRGLSEKAIATALIALLVVILFLIIALRFGRCSPRASRT